MSHSFSNKFALLLLILTITLHIIYSIRLNQFHFNEGRLNQHLSAASEARGEQEYVSAEKHYEDALKEAEKESADNKHEIFVLRKLWNMYLTSERNAEAEAVVLREVAVAEKIYGLESQELLMPLEDLTLVYLQQHKNKEALETLDRASRIIARGVDETHKAEAETLKETAEWLRSLPETQSTPEQKKNN